MAIGASRLVVRDGIVENVYGLNPIFVATPQEGHWSKMSKADPTMINWSLSSQKRGNDALLFRQFDSLAELDHVSMLTLPGAYWLFELGLVGQYPCTGFCCEGIERDEAVHEAMKVSADEVRSVNAVFVPCSQPCSARQYLRSAEKVGKRYDVIYLDYMGTWSNVKAEDMEIIFKNGMAKRFLALTMALHRGSQTVLDVLVDFVSEDHMDKVRMDNVRCPISEGSLIKIMGVPNMVKHIASQQGVSIELSYARVYDSVSYSTTQVRPEMVMLFTIER